MKRLSSVLALCLFLTIGAVCAETYSYPNPSRPLFSVNLPDNWKVEAQDELLHASPPDESLYLGFWAVETPNMDALGDAVGGIVDQVVQGFSINSEDDMEMNGIQFFYFEGTGRDPDTGVNLNASVALFSPNGETFCVMLYFGPPEAESRYESALIGIIQSIRSGGR